MGSFPVGKIKVLELYGYSLMKMVKQKATYGFIESEVSWTMSKYEVRHLIVLI